jgi:hypothetical protein
MEGLLDVLKSGQAQSDVTEEVCNAFKGVKSAGIEEREGEM